MILTSNRILEAVKVKAALTTGQAGLSNDQILQLATDAMNLELVPAMIDKFEGHFLFTDTRPLVPNVSAYRVPERAVAGALHGLFLTSQNGENYPLRKHEPSELGTLPVSPVNRPTGCVMVSNSITMVPPVGPNPSDLLTTIYYFQPSKLVMDSNGRAISAVSGNTVTLTSVPAGWSNQSRFDVVNHLSGNEIVAFDIPRTSAITGNTITFDVDVERLGVRPGNYLTIAGESIVPMIPESLHALLVEMTVKKVAEVRNDDVRIKTATAAIKTIGDGLSMIIGRRITTKPTVIRGSNPFF